MEAIFYTALVVAILYSTVSVFGWIYLIDTAGRIRERTGKKALIQIKFIPLILDFIVIIYWIWMIVRCFTE